MKPHRFALLMLLLGLAAGGAQAADMEGALRVTGRLMLDGNAPRGFSDGRTRTNTSDLVLSVLAAGEGRYTAERWQLAGRYDAGGRKYLFYSQEDVLVQAASMEGSLALGPVLGVGLEGRGKDRRGGSRAYTSLGASAFLEYAPDVRLALRVRAGLHRFLYRPDFSASYGGPEAGFFLRYRFNRRHALTLSGEYGSRRYAMAATPPPGQEPEPEQRREDGALLASVGYSWRGPVLLGVGYTYQEVGSNSFGEAVRRHRLSGNAGVRLPWRWMLLAQGSLGLTLYPDGLYLSEDILLVDDDAGENSLSLRLNRPLSEHLDMELSYAVYGTRLPRNELSYFRQVAGLGLTWRP